MKLWAQSTTEPFHILGYESVERKIPRDTVKHMLAFETKVKWRDTGEQRCMDRSRRIRIRWLAALVYAYAYFVRVYDIIQQLLVVPLVIICL